MFAEFFEEIKSQVLEAGRVMRTREFWIYVAVIVLMAVLAYVGFRLAAAFDPLTRGWVNSGFSCRTGQGQMATVIVGCFVFGITCVFTLGEVINWVESVREAKLPGREHYDVVSYWRPLLYILGTIVLGVGGAILLMSWCM